MAKTNRIIYFNYFDEDVTVQILKRPGKSKQILCDHPMFLKHFGLTAIFIDTYFDFYKHIPFPDNAFFDGMTKALKIRKTNSIVKKKKSRRGGGAQRGKDNSHKKAKVQRR